MAIFHEPGSIDDPGRFGTYPHAQREVDELKKKPSKVREDSAEAEQIRKEIEDWKKR
jgi:hypothetical protein